MSDSIALIIALALPLAVITFFRINGVMVFLSLCLGEVLVKFVGSDANSLVSLFSNHAGSLSKSTILLIFLLGPAVASAVFMIFSVHGHVKTMLNLLPAAGASFLGLLLAVPLLTPGLRHNIEAGGLWQQLSRAQDLIVGVSALLSLVFLWTQRHHKKHEGAKHHR